MKVSQGHYESLKEDFKNLYAILQIPMISLHFGRN